MRLQPILIGGQWQAAANPLDTFHAYNPATGEALPEQYPISNPAEIDQVLAYAQEALAARAQITPEQIALFLEGYAADLEAHAEQLAETAALETGLPKLTRLLQGELPRTTGQLRQAAAAVRDRSWCSPTIDTKNNIRSLFGPLPGAVFILGPNNFPFAFNAIAGGDFCAAVAAGNPVIAKAHPNHPATSRLLAESAFRALQKTSLPPSFIQMVYHMEPESGGRIIRHPAVAAVSFTGSKQSGLRLKAIADQAGKLSYMEMSSVNPVYLLPGAIAERPEALVEEFVASCTLGSGQFCTNPGLVLLLDNEQSCQFVEKVREGLEKRPHGVLFAASSLASLQQSLETWQAQGATAVTKPPEVPAGGYFCANQLFTVSGSTFLASAEALQTEAFGPVSLFVLAQDEAQLLDITQKLEGNLTGTIYSSNSGTDEVLYHKLAYELRPKVGRLLNDKMPTGVTVSPAMNHGGPYPATGHPGFTAVGLPAGIRRFSALYCYDNVRPHRLPAELQNINSGRVWRLVDGQWTQADIG